MRQYLDLVKDILENGVEKSDRTGVGTISAFGRMLRFNLQKGFPLLTTKKVSFRLIAHELLWLISGSTNIKYLIDNNVNIWNEWPLKHWLVVNGLWQDGMIGSLAWNKYMQDFTHNIKTNNDFAQQWGELGPVYGKQWRSWIGPNGQIHDQLDEAILLIKNDPSSRRILVNSWNPADLKEMVKSGLPPCHYVFQFYVVNNNLSCLMNMRSVDVFLGLPFNIASYALLTMIVAQVTKTIPKELVIATGDTHIYKNHRDQVRLQLTRNPKKLPRVIINPDVSNLDDFGIADFTLENYDPHEAIKGDIAV
ncbi:MAG: thymidylate synthase [Candidatus Woesebacteria bacterium]|nr:MAG: thymidylate synthase [Candidatus Woesebacteria bacterium]